MPRNEWGICAHCISPLWASTTWNSWMRSRFSASAISSSSASPRVPTSEKLCSRCPSAKSSHAAANSRLCCARASPSSRRHAGSSFRNVYLTKCRALIVPDYRSAGPHAGPRSADRVGGVRIALLSPYSWTYPGGVTRHIEALASELAARRPRSAHPRAVRPRRRALATPAPRRAPAAARPCPRTSSRSGARSGSPPTAPSRTWRSRRARCSRCAASCARAATTCCTSTSRSCRSSRWDALTQRRQPAAGRHLPHLLRERAHQRHRRRPARRAPAHEPPARADRGLRGRRLDRAALLRRALPHHPQRRAIPRPIGGAHEGRRAGAQPASRCGSCSSGRRSSARGCRCCCARSRRCASRSRRRSRSSARAPRRSRT